MSTRHPSKVFRIGFVSASVFAKEIDVEGGKRTFVMPANKVVVLFTVRSREATRDNYYRDWSRSVNVQKRYMDGESPKFTNSLGLGELSQAIRCLQLAQEYVESQEAEVNLSD